MTNLERYQSMSAEEFAEAFGDNSICAEIRYRHSNFCEGQSACEECVLEFLRAEYKEDDKT
jgi:hypothetical protein